MQLIQPVWAESPRHLTIFQHNVQARLSAHTDWISFMYLAQYPRLPFCVLFCIKLIFLWGRRTRGHHPNSTSHSRTQCHKSSQGHIICTWKARRPWGRLPCTVRWTQQHIQCWMLNNKNILSDGCYTIRTYSVMDAKQQEHTQCWMRYNKNIISVGC